MYVYRYCNLHHNAYTAAVQCWLFNDWPTGARRNLSAIIELYVQTVHAVVAVERAAPAVQCLEGRPFTFTGYVGVRDKHCTRL